MRRIRARSNPPHIGITVDVRGGRFMKRPYVVCFTAQKTAERAAEDVGPFMAGTITLVSRHRSAG